MKALVREGYGSLDVLHVRDVDRPAPKAHEVLVHVQAASINDFDFMLIERPALLFRLIGHIVRAVTPNASPLPAIPGCDVAGIVASVGSRVERFRAGDAVYGDVSRMGGGGFGGFAEYVCAPEQALAPKPATMTFEQAAALPQAGQLAVQGLFARGPLQPGWKILINGAGGGVGTIGVQLAKQHGVEVTGVDRASKLEMMRRIGFDHVIDYEREDFTKNGTRYDLILDTRTNRSSFAYLRSLTPDGAYVTVGGDTARLFRIFVAGWFFRLLGRRKLIVIALKQNKDLVYLSERFEAGQLTPVIDRTYTLSDARDALRYFQSANHKGKVIITVDAL